MERELGELTLNVRMLSLACETIGEGLKKNDAEGIRELQESFKNPAVAFFLVALTNGKSNQQSYSEMKHKMKEKMEQDMDSALKLATRLGYDVQDIKR